MERYLDGSAGPEWIVKLIIKKKNNNFKDIGFTLGFKHLLNLSSVFFFYIDLKIIKLFKIINYLYYIFPLTQNKK